MKPFEDGKFCIRKHTEENQHVLCVVFKGKPTHHLMAMNGDGHLTINKKVYKQTDDIETVCSMWQASCGISSERKRERVEQHGITYVQLMAVSRMQTGG